MVPLIDDNVREEREEFRVQLALDPLSSESERVILGQNETIITIEDDDSMFDMFTML